MSQSTGTTRQEIGLFDINGDGLADYFDQGAIQLGLGYEFKPNAMLNTPDAKSRGKTKGENHTVGAGSGSNLGNAAETRTFMAGLSAGISDGATAAYNTQMFLDLNGDGLPDAVRKNDVSLIERYNMQYSVQYNTGNGFLPSQEIYMPGWGNFTGKTAQDRYENNSDGELPLALETIPLVGKLFTNYRKSFNYSPYSNPYGDDELAELAENLDFNSTVTKGINGGINAGGTLKIKIGIFGLAISLNIGANGNAGANGSVSLTGVTARMLDINGDGFVDQVLRIPGMGTYAKLNLGAKVGLLKKITLPQGGTYELRYDERMGNTAAMPQSRYVLTSMTMNDNETERGGVHSYTTRYTYRDGYYDRIKKEFYGFSTVTTTYADQSHKVVEYHNRDYYAKGMEKTQAVYNSSGKPLRSSFSALDMAPYARVVETRSYSHDETSDDYVRTRITYAYDAYGNVSVLTDYGDESSVADIIIAEITYWIGGAAKYLHSHPVRIAVSSPSTGAVLRIREGTYNDNGSLVTLRQYYESGKEPLQQTYRYNQYGNLEETRDSVGVTVQYEYDGAARQYITKISQTRASGGESYASALEWDAARGHKLRETDPNGNSMAYRYDQRSRLTEIRSSYDTGSVPAVSYEYNTEAGTKWSATTRNKIVFDGNDHAVMLTVLELDGLGRPRRTAKAGEVYNPATRQTQQGWNVSGSVAYDGKGRTTQEGQTYFVPGAVVSLFLASPLAMLRETTKAYDSLDRVVKETLPDGSVQKTRYGITAEGQDRYAYTQTTDPLGNQTRQLRDERENIVRVERLDAQGKLLTKAAYWYNALGEMVLAKDAAGNPLQVAYDMLGRRTSLESYDSGRTDYTYNAKGQLWQESNGELRRQGKRIDYGYDSFGRLIKIDYPVSVDVIYEYGGPGAAAANLAGRLVRVSDESGEIRYEYGKLGEVVKERRAILQRTDGLGRSREAIMEYRSDYLGRMQAITYPDGETVRYGYDYGGNVVSVAGTKQGQAFPYVEKIGYDEWGQRVYLKLGNGVETTYTYNEDRRWLSRVLTESAGQAGKSVLQNIQYDFDMTGNVLSYANTAGTYSTSQEYAYDGLYQLVYAKGVSVNKPHGDFDYKAEYTQTYQFDALGLGNMTEKRSWTANTDPRRLGDPLDYEQDYAYAAGYAHRAERIGRRHYRYDLNGNVATEQDGPFSAVVSTGGHTITELENGTKVVDNGWGMNDNGLTVPAPKVWKREYAWNERNLLRTSRDDQHIVEYTYGQDGERSGKYSMTADGGHRHETLYFNKMWTWHYDGLLNEFTGRNSKHVYLGESRIVTKISHADGGSTAEERIKQYYYHSDHLGSAQVISNADGQEYERIEYTPYGELWIEKASAASNIDIPYRFTGKERDEETGLYYYGARYLDSKASRWLSTDPALGEYIPGAPVDNEARKQNQSLPGIGGVFNTVNLHLYHYAGNNPVKYVDPDGKDLHISVSRSQGTLTATYTPNEIYDDQYTEYLSKTTTTTSYNVITNVVKNNPNNNSSYDTSRTQRSEGGITNPTQLKNGTYQLTDSRAPSNSVNPSPKYKYGEPGEGIFINVIQMLPDVETGELVSDSGYMIHITPNAFTDGCIGIPYDPNEGSLSKSGAQNKMDRLVDWYNIATRRGENASISIVD
jgi:RHS repeat-associated protein